MPSVISTAGATEITHDGATYTADETGVFDMPEHVVAEIGKLHDLVNAAEHTAKIEAERLAEASKPESLHARLVAIEDVLAGIETHLAAKVEEAVNAAVAKVEDAVKAAAAKVAKKPPAKTTEAPAS